MAEPNVAAQPQLAPFANLDEKLTVTLKQWHKASSQVSPFKELHLFQQAQRQTGTAQLATNQVILTALDQLEAEDDHLANLLRLRFVEQMTMYTVAHRLNIAEGTAYKQQKHALERLARVLQARELAARRTTLAKLERRTKLSLDLHLIGADEPLNLLTRLLTSAGPPWLISVEGLGGIGKTALAAALIRELIFSGGFQDIGWLSARQQEFHPALGLQDLGQPALEVDTLTDGLLLQFQETPPLTASPQDKLIALTEMLKAAPYLIVVDNLETATDYEALLPTLRQLSNPSRFLLTSRHSLQAYTNTHCFQLRELSEADTVEFLRYEGELRGIKLLTEASPVDLERIYQVVGGNPLALKLVVGQITALPLSQVLTHLKQAQGRKVDEFYTYIYWQAWRLLEPASRQALLTMPIVQDGTLAQLALASRLDPAELGAAIEQLAALSLLEASGELDERRYRIHRLTETFLLTEVARWPSSL
jgi:hypothetical protein